MECGVGKHVCANECPSHWEEQSRHRLKDGNDNLPVSQSGKRPSLGFGFVKASELSSVGPRAGVRGAYTMIDSTCVLLASLPKLSTTKQSIQLE